MLVIKVRHSKRNTSSKHSSIICLFLPHLKTFLAYFEVALLRILSNWNTLLFSELKTNLLTRTREVLGDTWASLQHEKSALLQRFCHLKKVSSRDVDGKKGDRRWYSGGPRADTVDFHRYKKVYFQLSRAVPSPQHTAAGRARGRGSDVRVTLQKSLLLIKEKENTAE